MKKASIFSIIGLFLAITTEAAADDYADADEGTEQELATSQSEESQVDGWFRIDTDGLGTQLWVGGTYDLGAGVGLGTDIYVVGTTAELDLGIAFTVGPVSLLPMAGIVFDFFEAKTVSLVAPQLFTIIDVNPIYFESWIQVFLNDMFTKGEADSFYTRNFILLQVLDVLAIGPQIEVTYEFKNASDDELASLPIGGRINANYGENNTLGLFLGYETQSDDRHLAGRFTFIRTW